MINPYLIQQNTADTQTMTTIAPFDHRTNSRVKTNATCSQPAMNNPQMFTANPKLISSNTDTTIAGAGTLVPRTDVMAPDPGEIVPDMPIPETLTDPVFVPGFLATQIGKLMRIEFLIGNQITDRVGRLESNAVHPRQVHIRGRGGHDHECAGYPGGDAAG